MGLVHARAGREVGWGASKTVAGRSLWGDTDRQAFPWVPMPASSLCTQPGTHVPPGGPHCRTRPGLGSFSHTTYLNSFTGVCKWGQEPREAGSLGNASERCWGFPVVHLQAMGEGSREWTPTGQGAGRESQAPGEH